jgi:hypothetical protein
MAKKQPVQDRALMFVEQTLNAEVVNLIRLSAESDVRARVNAEYTKVTTLQAAELAFAKGLRYYHVKPMMGKDKDAQELVESPEEKAVRLEVVRHLEEAIESGFPQSYRDALALDVKKTIADANKALPKGSKKLTAEDLFSAEELFTRKQASTTRTVYKGRFADYLLKLEFPDVEKTEKAEKPEKAEDAPVSDKTPRQQFIDALNNAARIGRKDTDAPDEILGDLYKWIGKLGGTPDYDAE